MHGTIMFLWIFTCPTFLYLKVAEQIINPFGEDDDDFETNQLIDRNFQVSAVQEDRKQRITLKLDFSSIWQKFCYLREIRQFMPFIYTKFNMPATLVWKICAVASLWNLNVFPHFCILSFIIDFQKECKRTIIEKIK